MITEAGSPPLEEPKPSNVGKSHLMQEPAQRFNHLQRVSLKKRKLVDAKN
jgi:hypothetical protein